MLNSNSRIGLAFDILVVYKSARFLFYYWLMKGTESKKDGKREGQVFFVSNK